jgi:hypothetical protein
MGYAILPGLLETKGLLNDPAKASRSQVMGQLGAYFCEPLFARPGDRLHADKVEGDAAARSTDLVLGHARAAS